ncbi:MAG: T9SS type A sorting domain-containing protein [Bacteroidetes bacterium]|nr:T9SS type A sorting domain-containing protein [Bacteroidota bacterium]
MAKRIILAFFIGATTLPNFFTAQNLYFIGKVGGGGTDQGNGIVSDKFNNSYTIGTFEGTVDFDPSANTSILTSNGGTDIFVLKLNFNGGFVWAKTFGGINNDEGTSIALDSTGNIYFTGSFKDSVDFDPGSGVYNLASVGFEDIYVCKLNPQGNLIWAKTIGSADTDASTAITLSDSGYVYLTGYFNDPADFDPNTGTTTLTPSGINDAFVCKLDTSGNFNWAKNIGGTFSTRAKSIQVDNVGAIYLVGQFDFTTDFDPSPASSYSITSWGQTDAFVVKLDASGNLIWAKKLGGLSGEAATALALSPTFNHVYIAGYFSGSADFDPSSSNFTLTSNGSRDIFICQLDSSGNFNWANQIGGTSVSYFDEPYGICANSTGAYFTGKIGGGGAIDFDPSNATYLLTPIGNYDIFVCKLNTNGSFGGAYNVGGTAPITKKGNAITLDSWGNILTTGAFAGTVDFDPGSSSNNLVASGPTDCFIHSVTQSALSINDIERQNQAFLLFPNPANGFIQLVIPQEYSADEVVVVNALGTTLLSYSINQNESTIQINITSISDNLSFVQLKNKGVTLATQKLVIY